MNRLLFQLISCFTVFITVGCFPVMGQNLTEDQVDSLKTLQTELFSKEDVESVLKINTILIGHYAKVDNQYELVRQKVNRAEVLRGIGGLEEALKVLAESENIVQTFPYKTLRSSFYNRKAAILYQDKQKAEALIALRESQRIDSIGGLTWGKLSNLNIEGAIYRDLKQFRKARKVFENVRILAHEGKDTFELSSALYNLTHLVYRQKDFPAAARFGRNYMAIQKFENSKSNYGDLMHIVSRAYGKMQRFDSAYFFSDSVFGMRMTVMKDIIEENKNKYLIVNDLDTERLENETLNAEKETQSLQILILILAILVALLLIYFANKQRHHYQKVNKQHEQYNAELEHSLAFKNRLMSIVAHDIRNPIASLRGLIKVFNDGLVDEKDLGEMMHGLESMVVNVDLLLENLLTWVRSESEDLEAYMEDVELEDLLKNAVLEASPQLQTKGVTIDIKDPSKIPVLRTDFNFVSFILRNILSNAIKYSYEKGSISIICTQNEEQLCIEVQDYGKGMSRETLDQLRTNSVSQSRKGTDNEKGTALGLSLSYYFLNRLNGAMEIESELGQGTKVQIFLPLAAT